MGALHRTLTRLMRVYEKPEGQVNGVNSRWRCSPRGWMGGVWGPIQPALVYPPSSSASSFWNILALMTALPV